MNKLILGTLTAAVMFTAQPAFSAARVAVLHLAPFASDIDDTAVDIWVNGTLTFPDVKYKDFVNYVELDAGDYTIDIAPAGTTDVVITGDFTLTDGVDYSVAAIGNGSTQPLELQATVDDNTAPMSGNVAVRVSHTAPFAESLVDTQVSIRTAGGDVVNGLVGVPYMVNSGFFEIPADTYDLKVASNDGSVNYIDPLPAALPAGANVTIYAIGDGVNQPLGILAFPVGELPLRAPVDNSGNGWFDIGNGVGFILQPIPSQNRLVGSWYTYDAMGAAVILTFDSCMQEVGDPTCMTPGAFDGRTAETALFLHSGGGSDPDAVLTTERVGTIDFDLVDCVNATAMVTLDGQMTEEFNGVRLTQPIPCTFE
jgi:hypothetical protein